MVDGTREATSEDCPAGSRSEASGPGVLPRQAIICLLNLPLCLLMHCLDGQVCLSRALEPSSWDDKGHVCVWNSPRWAWSFRTFVLAFSQLCQGPFSYCSTSQGFSANPVGPCTYLCTFPPVCSLYWKAVAPTLWPQLFFKNIFYWLCYYSSPIFSPLYSPLPCTPPPTIIPLPYFMSVGCTYKFFGFYMSYTVLNLLLSILYLPFTLLIPCTFSPSLPALPPHWKPAMWFPFLWFWSCSSCLLSLFVFLVFF